MSSMHLSRWIAKQGKVGFGLGGAMLRSGFNGRSLSMYMALEEVPLARTSAGPAGMTRPTKSAPFWFPSTTSQPDLASFLRNKSQGLAVIPFWKRDFSTQMRNLGGSRASQIMVGGTQQVRSIMVEVKGNDLDRAIRKWRRKWKEENLKVLKDREYFKKPSEKRVLALKERDSRIARRAFKVKLNWIMSRRQRGF